MSFCFQWHVKLPSDINKTWLICQSLVEFRNEINFCFFCTYFVIVHRIELLLCCTIHPEIWCTLFMQLFYYVILGSVYLTVHQIYFWCFLSTLFYPFITIYINFVPGIIIFVWLTSQYSFYHCQPAALNRLQNTDLLWWSSSNSGLLS